MTKVATSYRPKLMSLYNDSIKKQLKDELGLPNIHMVPKLEKIVINVGLGRAKDDKKILETATNTLAKVTGQKPIQTTAKKSIASFKLREGNKIGLKVTLRGERMYEFADRLINIVLPRIRDFHGTNASAFDKSGNYSLGLSDQSIFAELKYEETTPSHGMQAIFVINGRGPNDSKLLLEKLGMPFKKESK